MKALVVILLILTLGFLGAAGYFFNEDRLKKERIADLEDENKELRFEVTKLQGQVDDLNKRLEEEIAKISQEKEEEIARLSSAHDELVKELQSEIDQKQVQITQLAGRLSVSLVDKILFPSGEADLTPAGLKVMERVGNIIKNVEDKVIRVEGHTDNVPISTKLQQQFPTNWELSTARATNVVRFMQEKVGIAPERLEAIGLSEYHPVASNETRQGRSKNRRIEISLVPTSAAVAN